jgi:hypothetical protein
MVLPFTTALGQFNNRFEIGFANSIGKSDAKAMLSFTNKAMLANQYWNRNNGICKETLGGILVEKTSVN